MIIDSHVHFWKYDPQRDGWITDEMSELRQDYLPENFEAIAKTNGVDGLVAVQADQSETETLFLKELASSHSMIKAVVGWVDLINENIRERLEYFSQFDIIKGFRHIVQSEPEGFLLNENFIRGLRRLRDYNYTYDVLVYQHQLQEALFFAGKVNEQPLIIDHCAKPAIGKSGFDQWAKAMRQMGQYPNVYCKLSGLLNETAWKKWEPVDFYPYLDTVFEAFGARRLLFGSDWPVLLLSGAYTQWKSLLEKYMENFSKNEKEAVMGGNAIDFYKI